MITVIKQTEASQVQETLIEQLHGLNPLFVGEYGVKAILAIEDGYGLRLHTRNRGKVINIDIIYRPCPDLYDIKAYKVDGLKITCEQIVDKTGIFFDQLHDVIRSILKDR